MTQQRLEVVETGWQSYRKDVINEKADESQLIECRRAFYAGATWLFACLNAATASDDIPDAVAVTLLEKVQQELNGFQEKVMNGKA